MTLIECLHDHGYTYGNRIVCICYLYVTLPAGGAVALDDPECLLQLVAVGEKVKQTFPVAGTVAQVDGDFSGCCTSLAVRCRKPEQTKVDGKLGRQRQQGLFDEWFLFKHIGNVHIVGLRCFEKSTIRSSTMLRTISPFRNNESD